VESLADITGTKNLIGGKARRLARMIRAGLPVKNGVVVTTSEVATILSDGAVPTHIQGSLASSLIFPVAVRSSGIGEDGKLTWAGQFKTKLQVASPGVNSAILECAEAVRSTSVRSYADLHGIPVPRLALIIQEMVHSSVSGVLFTRHPINGRRIYVIEAVEGYGEALVSGQCEPRRFYIDPRTELVIKTEGASKPELTPAQIHALVSFGRTVKRLFRADQDIEWAADESGNIFLLQSRDITALEEVKDSLECVLTEEAARIKCLGFDIEGDVLSDQNVAELLTLHPCRMAFGLFTYIFAHGSGAIRTGRNEIGYDIGPELEEGFFHLVKGQPRCSIVHDALTYRVAGIPASDYARLVDLYLGRISENPGLANYPELVLYDQYPSVEHLCSVFGKTKGKRYRRAYEQFFDAFRTLEDSLNASCRRGFLPRWRRAIKRHENVESLDLNALCQRYKKVADLLRTQACVTFVKAARVGFFAYARLRNLLIELYGDRGQEYVDILTSGIPAKDNPNLQLSIALFAMKNGQRSEEEVLRQFGHLAMHELEISVPRYRELPAMVRALAQSIVGNPRQSLEESVVKSLRLREKLVAQSGARRAELERAISMARTYLPLREVIKFEYLRGYDLLRRISLRIEQTLKWEDGLIFQLEPREILKLPQEHVGYVRLASERRQRSDEDRGVAVPPVIFSDRLEEIGKVVQTADSKTLHGIGVTAKVVEGTAVVVHSPDDHDALAVLKSGSILVTTTTDPAWSPMLSVVGKTGGLVTEVGGLLAHGAIYAREIGMAAVLNVPGITARIKTGMRIRVSGKENKVEILDE